MPRNTQILLFVVCTVILIVSARFLVPNGIGTSLASFANTEQQNTDRVVQQPLSSEQENSASATNLPADKTSKTWRSQVSKKIEQFILANRWNDAVSVIDKVYQQANAQELDLFKQQVMDHAKHLTDKHNDLHASALLEAYTNVFDDVDAWRELGASTARLSNWDTAVAAYLNASRLEHQPEALESLMQAVIRSAAHSRASLEQQDDNIGVLLLYQHLYDQRPNYARFQLELAQSFLRLGDDASAIPLLEVLQYDPELGSIGKQKLATIEQRREKLVIARQEERSTEHQADNRRRSDIVVPLIRSGNSFILDVDVNSRSVRMLLDTGASITALSANLISTLNLEPTGRYIQLTTANGVRRSQLFKSKTLQIGRFEINNLVIAEIDLSRSHGIQGLLGTDVLNKIDTQYSYLIDNQSNSLIFRRK